MIDDVIDELERLGWYMTPTGRVSRNLPRGIWSMLSDAEAIMQAIGAVILRRWQEREDAKKFNERFPGP